MIKTWKSLISLLLVLVFVFQLMPLSIFATNKKGDAPDAESVVEVEAESADDETELPREDSTEDFVIGEVDGLREESAKHFRMSDGSFLAVEYGYPIHYKTSENNWADIDNTLTKYGDKYVSANGDMVKSFSDSLNSGKLFDMQYKDYQIGMSLISEETSALPPEENEERETLSPEKDAQEVEPEETGDTPEKSLESEQSEETSEPEETQPNNSSEVKTSTSSEANQDKQEIIQYQNAAVKAKVENPSPTKKVVGESSREEMIALDMFKSSVRFDNAFSDTDLVYENVGYDLKESIVIHKKQGAYTYSFALALSNLIPEMEEDGSILLRNSDGEAIFEIPAPYMVDADGNTSNLVKYQLNKTDHGYNLSVIADQNWLNEQDRAFPVILDPTVTLYNTSTIKATFICSGMQYSSFPPSYNYSGLRCGKCLSNGLGNCEIVMQAQTLPVLPANCALINAQISFVHASFFTSNFYDATDGELPVIVQKLNNTSNSVSSLTYQGVHGTNGLGVDNRILDCNTLSYSTLASQSEKAVCWDITSAALEWLNAGQTRGAVLLSAKDCDNQTRFAVMYRPEYHDHCVKFYFQYRSVVGLESYYTYQEASAGRAGNVFINDFTQKLTLAHQDVLLSIAPGDYSITSYYNSSQTNSYFTNNPYSNINTCDFSTTKLGLGWKLSVQQTIVEKTIGEFTYLIYADEDGTEHYFFQDDGIYKDEDGLGLTITKSGSGSNVVYTMEDKDAYHTWTFNKGYLTSIEDHNGNMIYIAYNNTYASGDYMPKANQANQIKQVIQHTNSPGATNIELATFTYNSYGFLTAITDYAGRTSYFSYNGSNLSSITHPDGVTTYYTYHEYGGLTSAYDGESKCGLEFSYWNDHGTGEGYLNTVRHVKEYTAPSSTQTRTYGNRYHMFRNNSQLTSIRYYGADQVDDSQVSNPAEDDLVIFNAFDYYGRTISSYTTSYDKSKLLGVSAGAYEPNSTSTPEKNNRLSKSSSSGQHVVNLLKDGGFEFIALGAMGSNWFKSNSTTNTSIANTKAYNYVQGIYPHTGTRQMSTFLQSTNGYSRAAQYLVLGAGATYTFSAFVNTSAITGFDSNDDHGCYLMIKSGNELLAKSDVIRYQTNTNIENGWERLSVSYTPNTTLDCTVYLCQEGARGYAVFDDVQLERSESVSNVNLILNSDFDHPAGDNTNWIFENAQIGFQENDSTSVPVRNRIAILDNEAAQSARVSQTVHINKAGDTTYLLSGWGKASSAFFSEKDDSTTYDRFFGLIATITYYYDNTPEVQYVPFSSMYQDWQYCVGAIVPQKPEETVESIEVSCAYEQNIGVAYFDSISLIQEPCQTYFYDNDGNPTAVSSEQAISRYEYFPDTSKLMNYTTPSGTVHSFTYQSGTNNVATETLAHVTTSATYESSGVASMQIKKKDSENIYVKSSQTYDLAQNHKMSSEDVNGVNSVYNYDGTTHNLIGNQSGNLPTQVFAYNNSNNRTSQTYYSGYDSIMYNYNCSMLSSLNRKSFSAVGGTTPFWQKYGLVHDSFGNNTSVNVSGSTNGTVFYGPKKLINYTYESSVNGNPVHNGRLSQMEYSNGNTVSYSYDLFDRKTQETHTVNGNDVTQTYHYYYDSEGNLSKQQAQNASGSNLETYLYDYDSLGRLIHSKELDADGNMRLRTEHVYDSSNRIKNQNWMFGTGATLTQESSYSEDVDGDETLSFLSMHIALNGNLKESKIKFDYSPICQLTRKTTSESESNLFYRAFAYLPKTETNRTTNLAQWMNYRKPNEDLIKGYRYEYDSSGRIIAVYASLDTGGSALDPDQIYTYDELGQLKTADDNLVDRTYSYTYDTAGNIRTMTGGVSGNKTLSYSDSVWKDRLTSVQVGNSVESISYETATNGFISGNPVSYFNGRHYSFTWKEGRQLASAQVGGVTTTYSYDMIGNRSSKTVGSTTYEYDTLNDLVVKQTWDGKSLYFIYDDANQPYMLIYENGNAFERYYYMLNIQGDVIGIMGATGNVLGTYRYDPWGEVTVYYGESNTVDNSATSISALNPLRYRGYYYDTDTGLYYLQSRYYDPAIGRFLNADVFPSTSQGFFGCNMFGYCGNNPVNHQEVSGEFYVLAAAAISGVIGAATGALSTLAAGGDGIEILIAAIAGMGAGAIAIVSPGWSAVIAGYASYEIDAHMQRRLNPNEEVNQLSAIVKGVAAGATNILTGKLIDYFDVVPKKLLTEQFKPGFSMVTYFFDLVNATIILPVSSAIDSWFAPQQIPRNSTFGGMPSSKNKMPPFAPSNALYV